MALRSARALPLSALLLLANAAISVLKPSLTVAARIAAAIDRPDPSCTCGRAFLTYADNLRALDSRFCGLALTPLVSARGVLSHSRRGIPGRPVSGRRLSAHSGGRTPVRPRQVRRLSDLPVERRAEGLLRRAQRSLRRRIPEAIRAPGPGSSGLAGLLGILPFHPRAAARRRALIARTGTDRLAPDLRG